MTAGRRVRAMETEMRTFVASLTRRGLIGALLLLIDPGLGDPCVAEEDDPLAPLGGLS